MAIKVGINGYGRIGRNVLRALYEGKRTGQLQIVALNDLCDSKTNAHLTRYDTVHGRFPFAVEADGSDLVVDGKKIHVSSIRNPAELPWKQQGIDIVMECTGVGREEARSAIERAEGSVKLAIVMARRGVGAAEARRLLEAAGGFVRPVVGDPPAVKK